MLSEGNLHRQHKSAANAHKKTRLHAKAFGLDKTKKNLTFDSLPEILVAVFNIILD